MLSDALQPWHIILLVVVLLLLFGSRRLPGAAKSLGESMHIFKKSVTGLHDDEADQTNAANPPASALPPVFTPPAVQQAAPPAQDATQQQLADLHRQVQELQRQSAGGDGQVSETQTSQQL